MTRLPWIGVLFILVVSWFPPAAGAAPGRISFRIYGGGAYVSGGDLNDGLQGWADFWKANYAYQGSPYKAGAYKPVHVGFDFGGEVVFSITSRLGIGLGAEFLRAKQTTNMTFQPDIDWTFSGEPSVVPVKLSIFYGLPAGKSFRVVLQAGLGYYFAQARLESHRKPPRLIDYVIDSSAKGLGYHGGLGLEWDLSPRFALFIEAAGRYAPISGFTGKTTVTDSSGTGSWDGKLYYFGASASYIQSYNYIDLLAGEPGGAGLKFKREAKVDFSGLAARLGIAVRL